MTTHPGERASPAAEAAALGGTTHRVLVVDDVEDMLDLCAETLRMLDGVEVVTELDARAAVERLREEPFDALVADIRMASMDGVELLRRAREHDPSLPVVMLTGHPNVEKAVECLRLGAADYITKPMNPDDLQARVLRCLRERRLRDENVLLRRQVERAPSDALIVGASPAMRAALDLIDRVAGTDVDVLVTGEPGTGKELVARAIHARSRRRGRTLIPVDVAAVPAPLLEAELFGSVSVREPGRSIGLLELAAGGTLFLDELGALPPALQPRLLRALQERRIRRAGATTDLAIDARVVAATARSPARLVELGELRQDLYYRLGAVTIELPPLRERGDDVVLLAEHFRSRFVAELGKAVSGFTVDALAALRLHRWPGNVRELLNVVRRGVALARGADIGLDELPPALVAEVGPTTSDGSYAQARRQALAVFEREYLTGLLRRHAGDVPLAMAQAHVSRASFYRMLRACDLRAGDFRPGSAPPPASPDGDRHLPPA